jgi:glyoxylase-like metal-dependent hydrolase (beta-lactamase superfamily II)
MKIGKYEIHPIETGRFRLDGGAMFGVVPRPLWERTNQADERNRIELAARPMLIVGNERRILVDNGNGSKLGDKLIDIYGVDTSKSDLFSSLAKLGLKPQDVTDVIITHLHFDHAGGSTIREAGKLVPTFPNAKYYVQKGQWEQATNPTEKDRASYMPDDFIPLQQHGVLELLDGEGELFPQIEIIVANGHTASQQLVKISDGTNTVLYCCDLIPTTSHIPLPYIMAYDLRPLTTLKEKRNILARASEERWILFFEHDPKTATGTVRATDRGFALDKPVEIA